MSQENVNNIETVNVNGQDVSTEPQEPSSNQPDNNEVLIDSPDPVATTPGQDIIDASGSVTAEAAVINGLNDSPEPILMDSPSPIGEITEDQTVLQVEPSSLGSPVSDALIASPILAAPTETTAIESALPTTAVSQASFSSPEDNRPTPPSPQTVVSEAISYLPLGSPSLTINSIHSPERNSPERMNERERVDGKPIPFHKRSPYNGGYLNTKTGVEYFNAYTQTPRHNKYIGKDAPARFHREVQTKFIRNRKTQNTRENGTQMDRTGCYVSNDKDQIFIPSKYETADEYEAKLIKSVITIQCFVRKVFAIRRTNKLYREAMERKIAINERENKKKDMLEQTRRKEIERRLHPRSNKDFETLFNGLEKWRFQETQKIEKADLEEPVRLALMADLLEKEAQLIQKIDRLKLAANEENKALKIQQMLEDMASPLQFKGQSGAITFVSTQNIIRAAELRDLYVALTLPLLSVDERLQVLLQVKYTMKEFDCTVTREAVKLIDREGDLLSRGVHEKNLEGLRKRIANLFLVFLKTPEFNPEAEKYQKFPDAGKSWQREKSVFYCRGCTKYLPSTNFSLSATMKHLGLCKACKLEENLALERIEDSAYMKMLETARDSEVKKRKTEIYATSKESANVPMVHQSVQLMQERDMRYLIDTIWGAQSAISAKTGIHDLVLTRWDGKKELSPWNCIVLTKSEALVHDLSSDPENTYAPDFVKKIKQKHIAAHAHFSQLPDMQTYVKEAFYEEKRTGKILHRKLLAVAGGKN